MTDYEIKFPAFAMRFKAKDKKDALKKAKQNMKALMDAFLMNPKYWKEI